MSKVLYRIGLAILCAAFAATVVSATTNTYSFGSNLGTLTYTVTSYSRNCVSAYGNVNYTEYDYSGFSYSDPQAGISQPISGETYNDEGIGGGTSVLGIALNIPEEKPLRSRTRLMGEATRSLLLRTAAVR